MRVRFGTTGGSIYKKIACSVYFSATVTLIILTAVDFMGQMSGNGLSDLWKLGLTTVGAVNLAVIVIWPFTEDTSM